MTENIMLNRVGVNTQPCLTPHGHWEWQLGFPIILYSEKHAIIKLPDPSDEPVRTAKLVHDLPEHIMADSVQGFG